MKEGRSAGDNLLMIGGALALVGVAVLSAFVGLSWDREMTRVMVGGLIAVCAGGVVVFALVVGALVGVGVLRRLQRPDDAQHHYIDASPQRGPWLPYSEPNTPALPMLTDQVGEYRSNGQAGYTFLNEVDLDLDEPRTRTR